MMVWDRVHSRTEMIRNLTIAQSEGLAALIWQNPQESKRISAHALVVEIDDVKKELILIDHEENLTRIFKRSLPFYLRFNHRGLLLKTSGYFQGEALVLALPEEIVLQENRKNVRLNYGESSTFRADLRKVDRGIITQENFQLPLFDAGPGGYSVLISGHESNVFFPGDLVLVYQLGALKFSEPLRSRVRYLLRSEQRSKSRSREFKMGLEFERAVSLELLQTLPYADW